ncbi:unnamed protein product [Boreogadus saida]
MNHKDSMKSMNRDMEEKGIVLRELRCRTAAEASAMFKASAAIRPPSSRPAAAKALSAVRQLCSAAIRQLSSGSTIPFFSMTPPDCRRSFGGAARRERDCTPGAELPRSSPPPELLVRWSTKS